MFDGDERGEKIDLKENTAPSGDESFMLRLDQKRPFALLDSAAFVLLLCCLAANKILGEDILAHNPGGLPETRAGRSESGGISNRQCMQVWRWKGHTAKGAKLALAR
jgi:hypothetical protein